MRLLLDTQIALWWLTYPKRLVPSVREWVEQAEDGVFVSRASLWELAIKISFGKLRLDLPKFVRQAERDGFFWLSIDTRHLLAVAELPTFNDHKDSVRQAPGRTEHDRAPHSADDGWQDVPLRLDRSSCLNSGPPPGPVPFASTPLSRLRIRQNKNGVTFEKSTPAHAHRPW